MPPSSHHHHHLAASASISMPELFAMAPQRTSNKRKSTSSGVDSDNDINDDVFAAVKRVPKRKASTSATHELRHLREEAALLQYQLDSLKLKWRRLGVETDLLTRACDAALAKRDAQRSMDANRQFKAQLLQQQLFFASIQGRMVSESPLLQVLSPLDVFMCLHLPLQLPGAASPLQRQTQLVSHCEELLRFAPAILNRFTQKHVDKATLAVPFTHMSLSGGAEHTLVASVFICKLRNLSVDRVFQAAMCYHEALPLELKRCLRVDLTAETEEELQSPTEQHRGLRYARTRYSNETSGITSSQSSVSAARLSEQRGVLVTDFVDDEDTSERIVSTTSALVISPFHDKSSGEQQVLLQRLVVHRYALRATSRKLHEDVTSTTPFLNGDLLMAVMCRELQASAE